MSEINKNYGDLDYDSITTTESSGNWENPWDTPWEIPSEPIYPQPQPIYPESGTMYYSFGETIRSYSVLKVNGSVILYRIADNQIHYINITNLDHLRTVEESVTDNLQLLIDSTKQEGETDE